ncbi:unnamed protein product [Rhizopus stolonifer]
MASVLVNRNRKHANRPTSSRYVDLESQWVDDIDIDSDRIPTKQTVDQKEWNDWYILKEKLLKVYLRSLEKSKSYMPCTSLAKQEACKECHVMQTSNFVIYYTDSELQEAIAVRLNLIKSSERKTKAEEEANKAVEETAYRLRSKAKSQGSLVEATKQYQSTKFEADTLMSALDASSNHSVTSQSPPQIEVHEYDNVFTMKNKTESMDKIIKKPLIFISNMQKGLMCLPQQKL